MKIISIAIAVVAVLGISGYLVFRGEPSAQAGDTLSVLYTGTLEDGTVFDASSLHGNQPFVFKLGAGEVIKGWDQGLLGMKKGEKKHLVLTPDLAYGENGIPNSPIGPNATLIFDVELVEINHAK